MKKNLTIIGLFLLVCSCDSETESSISKADSLKLKKRSFDMLHPNHTSDSLESLKAIGNINFGVSKNEFAIQRKKYLKGKYQPADENYYLGNYRFRSLSPLYYRGKLYALQLKGMSIGYEDYKLVTAVQCRSLYEILVAKYGRPREYDGIPDSYRIRRGEWRSIAYWMLGEKVIDLKINNEGLAYTVDLFIYQNDIQELINRKEEQVDDSLKNAGKDDL